MDDDTKAYRASMNQNAEYLTNNNFGISISWDEMHEYKGGMVKVKGKMMSLNTIEKNGRMFAFYENDLYEVINGELDFNDYVSYSYVYGA